MKDVLSVQIQLPAIAVPHLFLPIIMNALLFVPQALTQLFSLTNAKVVNFALKHSKIAKIALKLRLIKSTVCVVLKIIGFLVTAVWKCAQTLRFLPTQILFKPAALTITTAIIAILW